jgi:DNA-binding CsgD family transcriptional regulator
VGVLPVAQERGATQRGVLDLSAREREILERVCVGNTNLDIAAALDISPFTVKNHVQRIFRKIGVTNRTQAAARYTQALRERELAQAPSPRPPAEAPGTWQVARPHAVAAASFSSSELSPRASR